MIVYIHENGLYRFVKNYSKGGFLRREHCILTYDIGEAADLNTNKIAAALDLLGCDKAMFATKEDFAKIHSENRMWCIERAVSNDTCDYYRGIGSKKKGSVPIPLFADNIQMAFVSLSEEVQKSEMNTIRMNTNAKVRLVTLYTEYKNELLTPQFIVACTDKEEVTMFLSSVAENGEISLVGKSSSALVLPYDDVVRTFERLRCTNKKYLYSVFPKFTEDVWADDIEEYLNTHKVSRSVAVSVRLCDLNKKKDK